jgi:hypothetical protein
MDYSHLIVIHGYVNLVIFSSKIENTELYRETDLLIRTKSISQIIFDSNMKILILFSSEIIYYY